MLDIVVLLLLLAGLFDNAVNEKMIYDAIEKVKV